jgi:hypothetical protein
LPAAPPNDSSDCAERRADLLPLGEVCDMVDNDCNGIVDDNCVNGR